MLVPQKVSFLKKVTLDPWCHNGDRGHVEDMNSLPPPLSGWGGGGEAVITAGKGVKDIKTMLYSGSAYWGNS